MPPKIKNWSTLVVDHTKLITSSLRSIDIAALMVNTFLGSGGLSKSFHKQHDGDLIIL